MRKLSPKADAAKVAPAIEGGDSVFGPLAEGKGLWTALVSTGMDPFEALDLVENDKDGILTVQLWTTVGGFTDFVACMTEVDAIGEPYGVWLEPAEGLSDQVARACWDHGGNLILAAAPVKDHLATNVPWIKTVDLPGMLTIAGLKAILGAAPFVAEGNPSGRIYMETGGQLEQIKMLWPLNKREDGQDLLLSILDEY
jgi:hypothetical protein